MVSFLSAHLKSCGGVAMRAASTAPAATSQRIGGSASERAPPPMHRQHEER